MNTIITVKQLVSMIAQVSGADATLATRFVDEFTRTVGAALERDGRVEIAGFGIFSRDGIGGDKVTFVPDEEIAAAVNAPFEMFEPVELDDNYVDEPTDIPSPASAAEPAVVPEHTVSSEPAMPPKPVHPPVPVCPVKPAPTPEPEPVVEPVPESPAPAPEPEITSEPEPAYVPEPEPVQPQSAQDAYSSAAHYDADTDYESYYEDHPDHKHHSFRSYVLMLVGFVMLSFIIGTVAGYFAYPLLNYMLSNDEGVTIEQVAVEEIPVDTQSADDEESSAEEVSTDKSDETTDAPAAKTTPAVVTDTVEAGNSLAKIARTHYGKSDFWVYIYEANADKLGNPDNIASGTVLVIPPASQYDIDPNDPESIRKARAKASQIYNKYR